jgi:hypothetical protein
MWKGLAIVGCLLAPLAARGHIGDNLAQLRQTYGATGKQAANTMIFQRNGYSICVYFDGDRSAMEIFTRDGSDKAHTTISPQDIEGILKLEGKGQGWSSMVGTKTGNMVWLRADRKLIAHLSPGATPKDAVFVVMENQK